MKQTKDFEKLDTDQLVSFVEQSFQKLKESIREELKTLTEDEIADSNLADFNELEAAIAELNKRHVERSSEDCRTVEATVSQ